MGISFPFICAVRDDSRRCVRTGDKSAKKCGTAEKTTININNYHSLLFVICDARARIY